MEMKFGCGGGWLAYGAALNEGRALFDEDKAFGKWIAENLSSNLVETIHPADRAAAMWAAANGIVCDPLVAGGFKENPPELRLRTNLSWVRRNWVRFGPDFIGGEIIRAAGCAETRTYHVRGGVALARCRGSIAAADFEPPRGVAAASKAPPGEEPISICGSFLR